MIAGDVRVVRRRDAVWGHRRFWWGPALGRAAPTLPSERVGFGRLHLRTTCSPTYSKTSPSDVDDTKTTLRTVNSTSRPLFDRPRHKRITSSDHPCCGIARSCIKVGIAMCGRCVGECCDSGGDWRTDRVADQPNSIWLSDARYGPGPASCSPGCRGGGSFTAHTPRALSNRFINHGRYCLSVS